MKQSQYNAASQWSQGLSESLVITEDLLPQRQHYPLSDIPDSQSDSPSSGLDPSYVGAHDLRQISAQKPSRWRRCVKWKPQRNHVFILSGIFIFLQIGIIVWFSLLTAFIRRVSRAPSPKTGITRLIDSLSPSTPILASLQSQRFSPNFTRGISPIPCHSHNDYWRNAPLLDAMAAGCTSVEVDIWVSGHSSRTTNTSELYVSHTSKSLETQRTLRSMYLDPVVYILDQFNFNAENNETESAIGVFDTSSNTTLVLLLDFKDSSPSTNIWTLVQTHLQPLREKNYLTFYNSTSSARTIRPLTIVASGSAPFELIASNPHHDIFYDAPLSALPSPFYNTTNSYYASTSLKAAVGKIWFDLTGSQKRKVKAQIEAARDAGLLSRYWDTPGWPINVRDKVWEQLIRLGADILNVDELGTAARRNWRLCWAVGWGICV